MGDNFCVTCAVFFLTFFALLILIVTKIVQLVTGHFRKKDDEPADSNLKPDELDALEAYRRSRPE